MPTEQLPNLAEITHILIFFGVCSRISRHNSLSCRKVRLSAFASASRMYSSKAALMASFLVRWRPSFRASPTRLSMGELFVIEQICLYRSTLLSVEEQV